MKIRIHRGFRAVLSVLVTVMLLVGVMPLSAVLVHAESFTVYFCLQMGSKDWDGEGRTANVYAGGYNSKPEAMDLVVGSYEENGYDIYYKTFSGTPSSLIFSPSASWGAWQSVSVTGADIKDGYVYYINTDSTHPPFIGDYGKMNYYVGSTSYAGLAPVVCTIYCATDMASGGLSGWINTDVNGWEEMKQYNGNYYGFNIYYRCFTSFPTSLQLGDSQGNTNTITSPDIKDGYLYYCKVSNRQRKIDSFSFSDLRYEYLTSSDTFKATPDMNVIVDSAGTQPFKQNAERHYVKATMYDYFSDYEIINGTTRTGGNQANAVNAGITSPYGSWEDPCRRMQLLTFDKALSDGVYSASYQHPLYFGDIHDEGGGYYFSIYNGNQWNLNYYNLTDGTDVTDNNGTLNHNAYQQLYHDNNSTRRSGLNVTDQSQSANAATTGLYQTSLSAYNKTADNTVNAARLKLTGSGLTGGADAKWFDSTWLASENSTTKRIGVSYDVDFPFWTINMARTIGSQTYDSCDYYYINSEKKQHALRMHKDTTGKYYLKETGEGVYNFSGNDEKILDKDPDEHSLTTTYGFFPFNSKQDFYEGGVIAENTGLLITDTNKDLGNLMNYRLRMDRTNYCFGTYMVIPFTLTSNNGTVNGTTDANDAPITFTFSGDDDLLVYIDNQLVLDIGGDHGKVQGEINLKEKKSWVSAVKTSNGTGTQNITWSGNDDTKLQTMSAIPASGAGVQDLQSTAYNGKKIWEKGDHVMEIFYVERGLFDSNMEIMYNLPVKEDRSFTVEEHIPTSTVVANQVDSVFTSGSTGATNFMTNVDRIKLGINVQFSEPNATSNFGTLLGERTEYKGDHPDQYTFNSANLYSNTFGSDTINKIYTTEMGNGQKLTYVNDFIKPYNYNLKVSEGNIFIGNDDTGQAVDYLFTTNWTLAKLSGTPQAAVNDPGPAHTTSSSSRPARGTKTTSTSATNNSNGFDFRGTQENPDQIVFNNELDTYTLQVSKEFHRKANDNTSHTFTITVEFNNVGGLNLEEPNAATPADNDNDGFGIVLTKTLTFTFNSGEGTGSSGTTKTAEAIIVPANTKYKVTETTRATGYDVFDEVTGFTSPSGNTEIVNIKNKPPEHNPIILKIQKIWENTDTLPASIKFKIEKSTDSGQSFASMTSGTVVNASGQAITGVTFSDGDLTLNSNCQTTLGDGRTAWVAYIYDIGNLSDNTHVYRVTEYNGNSILNDNDTFKPGDITFKVKYPNGDGLTNSGHYNSETQSDLTNPSGLTANYGNENHAGRILTLSVINKAFIKIRVQSYFTQADEDQQTNLPTSIKFKVQRSSNGSTWEAVQNSSGQTVPDITIDGAPTLQDSAPTPRKYYNYELPDEYDPDYNYKVLEYTSDGTTLIEGSSTPFNTIFTTVSYNGTGGIKPNECAGTNLDSDWTNEKGITLAIFNSGESSPGSTNTGGRGGYIPIAGGFIAILLAGAGYFIYKKRIFA